MTTSAELTCQELVELVTEYLEDALAPEDRTLFEAHLAGCDGCSAYVEQMRATIRRAGALTSDNLPPEAVETLLAAFRSWRARGVRE